MKASPGGEGEGKEAMEWRGEGRGAVCKKRTNNRADIKPKRLLRAMEATVIATNHQKTKGRKEVRNEKQQRFRNSKRGK